MRAIIGSEVFDVVPPRAHAALKIALWRFNHLFELEDFPPFKKIKLDQSGELADDPAISNTEVGNKFAEECLEEFWRVNEIYDSSDDEDVLLELFSNAFALILNEFKSEIHVANLYQSHYQDSQSALVAAEVFADPSLESLWGSPLPEGVYRCESCLHEYPEFLFDLYAEYRCEECKEIMEFSSHPSIGDDDGLVRRAGTLRRLVNRVSEGINGRRTGQAGSATTRQILRESPLGKKFRAFRDGQIKGQDL